MRRLRALFCVVLSFAAVPLFAVCTFDFLAGVDYPASPGPEKRTTSLAAADFNKDGRPDLAVRLNDSDRIAILLGLAEGGFGDPVEVAVGRRIVGDIAAGDINGDGNPDLVAPNEWENNFQIHSALNILWGDGDGTFTVGTPVNLYQNPYHTLIADFTGDGKGDVALAKMTSFVLLKGTANGVTQTADISIAGNSQFVPDEIAHGDLDGDGKLDVIVGDFAGAQIHTFFGNGNGTFVTGPKVPLTDPDYWADGIAIGDFDGDGDGDIAYAENDPSGDSTVVKKVAIYSSNGAARTFANPVRHGDVGTAAGINEAAALDIDGDSDTDLVVATYFSVIVLLNDGTGALSEQESYGTSGYGLAIADFDRDGGPDVASANFGWSVDVYLNFCGRVKLNVTPSANPSHLGNSVTFTGTVTPPPAATPTGTLTLKRGDTVLATKNLANGMSLAHALSDLPLGNTFITAEYSGDSRFAAGTYTHKQVVQLAPFGAPTKLTAMSTGGPVTVSWIGTADVAHYEVWRSGAGAGWAQVGTSATMEFFDGSASPSAAWIYKVRGVKADGTTKSAFSNVDLASTFAFTDETLTVGVTKVKLEHLTQLRNAAASARAVAGLTPHTWAEASPTIVKASHWTELRTVIEQVRTALALAAGTYTATPTVGQKALAVHVTQLRANLR